MTVEARVELPPGPCLLLRDPSGNPLGLVERVRPTALEAAYADPASESALRWAD